MPGRAWRRTSPTRDTGRGFSAGGGGRVRIAGSKSSAARFDVDIAARKQRRDQRRAMRRRGAIKLIDIGILGPPQHRQRAAIGEILGIVRAAMRQIQDERHGIALRIATPHHARYFQTRRSCFAIPPCNRRRELRQAATSCELARRHAGRGTEVRRAERRGRWRGLPLRDDRDDASEPHEFLRVLRLAVDDDLVMHMRPGRAAGAAEKADLGLRRDMLPDRHGRAVQVPVAGREPVAVVDLDDLAVIVAIAGERHDTRSRSRRPATYRER